MINNDKPKTLLDCFLADTVVIGFLVVDLGVGFLPGGDLSRPKVY